MKKRITIGILGRLYKLERLHLRVNMQTIQTFKHCASSPAEERNRRFEFHAF
jgi:hypothetical protein